jgi:Tc5 transposase DNA-binding domain
MSEPTTEARMALALADLSKQSIPNFLGTSKKYNVNRTTLSRRFKGTQRSQRDFHSESIQCLTAAQEAVVVGFINEFTNRYVPPTSRIVKNVAEEVSKATVSKNWVAQFTRRHKDKLCARYMDTIDSARVKADNIPLLNRFYEQVSVNILAFCSELG